jgi:hypothetical protein
MRWMLRGLDGDWPPRAGGRSVDEPDDVFRLRRDELDGAAAARDAGTDRLPSLADPVVRWPWRDESTTEGSMPGEP